MRFQVIGMQFYQAGDHQIIAPVFGVLALACVNSADAAALNLNRTSDDTVSQDNGP